MRSAICCLILLGCLSLDREAAYDQAWREGLVPAARAIEVAGERARRCEFGAALSYLNQLPDWLRRDPNVVHVAGILLGHLDRPREALREFQSLDPAELNPTFRASVRLSMGLTYSQLRQFEPAMNSLNAAREHLDEDALVLGSMGIVYAEANQFEKAERSFRNAIELDPLLPSALFNLAAMKARRGHVDEAEALLRRSWEAGLRDPVEIRRERFFQGLIESGKIDDLLKASTRECVF